MHVAVKAFSCVRNGAEAAVEGFETYLPWTPIVRLHGPPPAADNCEWAPSTITRA
jgi:hypothetical protein